MSTAENHAHQHDHGHGGGHGHDHAHDHAHHELSFWAKYVFPLDHKMIAMQYLFTGMLMALIGGFTVYVFRMQLAFPGAHVPGYGVVSPDQYNMLVTTHGSVMIFWVAMPVLIAALGNYLIPLMIGADDMVFPKPQPALVPDLPDQLDRPGPPSS
jgi:cytochrome c oxidase subunit 1